jgi:hypothetical protein
MSNLFMIPIQASTPLPPSTLNPAILAPRAGLKPKPLAERQSLHAVRDAPGRAILLVMSCDR